MIYINIKYYVKFNINFKFKYILINYINLLNYIKTLYD